MFCIGAFSSLSSCLDRLSKFVPLFRRCRPPSQQCQRPCRCQLSPMNLSTMISMAVALTTVIIWYIYRREDWSWILQDVLGAAVCIAITSIYRLGNMRVITLILLGFFLYDIFFVFVTPYIPIFQPSSSSNSTGSAPSSSSSSHSTSVRPSKTPSVMEQVALGFGTNGEVVPLLFALPMFVPEAEFDPCLAARKSMLGFGDVILPVSRSSPLSKTLRSFSGHFVNVLQIVRHRQWKSLADLLPSIARFVLHRSDLDARRLESDEHGSTGVTLLSSVFTSLDDRHGFVSRRTERTLHRPTSPIVTGRKGATLFSVPSPRNRQSSSATTARRTARKCFESLIFSALYIIKKGKLSLRLVVVTSFSDEEEKER